MNKGVLRIGTHVSQYPLIESAQYPGFLQGDGKVTMTFEEEE